jgi:predicted amidohydrolase YtcJ
MAAAAVALAVGLFRIQQPLFGPETKSYCYQAVRTHDTAQPVANCFSVSSGHFARVYNTSADDTEEIQSGYAIPGLWDGHGHLMQYGEFLHSVDLFGSTSLEDVRTRLKDYMASNPGAGTKDEWIRGIGWDQTAFGRMPTAVSRWDSVSLGCSRLTPSPGRPRYGPQAAWCVCYAGQD